MKRVMVVVGSPRRNGNCATLAERIADTARGRGVEVAVAGGDRGSGLDLVERNVRAITAFMGRPLKVLAVPSALQDPDDILGDADLREKAEVFTVTLLA